MSTLLQDVKYGVRLLLRSPALTIVAALSLALGIGANTTIFTLVNAILLNPLPVKDVSTLVTISTTEQRNGVTQTFGATDPLQAETGSVRADFGLEKGRNLTHASDGPESAQRELGLFFEGAELASWRRDVDAWVME